MRKFDTGATRNDDSEKYDYEGFLSPLAIEAYGRYMHEHRVQADGSLRASDNWQKGIPRSQYLKSLWRHFFDLWKLHRGYPIKVVETDNPAYIPDVCCAIMFNVMGYLHSFLKGEPDSE